MAKETVERVKENIGEVSGRASLPIVIVGHVDHGKSTLIGRLLFETGSLPEGKVEALQEMARRRGMPFEWSFVTDALQAERDQGITIDSSQVRFHSARRQYVMVDAPGHKEFLKNMVTGAAAAEAAILVVDVTEGLSEQTRRHAYLLELLGIRHIVVVVNKMDAAGYARDAFDPVREAVSTYLGRLGLGATAIIPISAREGDGITTRPTRMRWYDGPSLMETLDSFPDAAATEGPLRLPVQDVYKFDERRIIAGRIESGRLRVGDTLRFLPGDRQARIATIETWNAAPTLVGVAGQSIGITLDEDIFVERGQLAGHADSLPQTAPRLRVRLFSFASGAMRVGERLTLRLATSEYPVTIESIDGIIEIEALAARHADQIGRYDIADVVLTSSRPVVVDDARQARHLRRGVLARGHEIAAACTVEKLLQREESATANTRNLFATRSSVRASERSDAYGHVGGIMWMTGLSGSGKSTIARALERELFERGWHAVLVDGDAVRQGLNSDLGFSPADRSENVRRIGEVARIVAESGLIAIVACISPIRGDREQVHQAAGELFHEIYIKAKLETCLTRDPKGLYQRATSGEITEFTGVSAPYEAPLAPALEIDTDQLSAADAARQLLAFVEARLGRRNSAKAAS